MNVRMQGPAALVVGLHLGCMQTGYLLTLSRALSSAHTTYALVLAAWLAGAALGLWVAMGQRVAIAIGLVAYLGVTLGLSAVDFVALPAGVFAPAVAASGLWSGRFFAVAVSGPSRPGRVFAAETDGFLLGAITAVIGMAFFGRVALVVLPVLSGVWLLGGRWRGGALALLMCGGCDDARGTVPAPDFATFRDAVYPVLLRDCGFAGCHGDPQRPLFTPGPGRVRLDPETDVYDAPTGAELERAYDRARGLLLREGDEPAPLVHKPGPDAAHKGRDAEGRNVYEDEEAANLVILRAWADAAVAEEAQ